MDVLTEDLQQLVEEIVGERDWSPEALAAIAAIAETLIIVRRPRRGQ